MRAHSFGAKVAICSRDSRVNTKMAADTGFGVAPLSKTRGLNIQLSKPFRNLACGLCFLARALMAHATGSFWQGAHAKTGAVQAVERQSQHSTTCLGTAQACGAGPCSGIRGNQLGESSGSRIQVTVTWQPKAVGCVMAMAT